MRVKMKSLYRMTSVSLVPKIIKIKIFYRSKQSLYSNPTGSCSKTVKLMLLCVFLLRCVHVRFIEKML